MQVGRIRLQFTRTDHEPGRLPIKSMLATCILVGFGLGLFGRQYSGRKRLRSEGAQTGSASARARIQGSDSSRLPEAVGVSLLYAVPPIWLASSLSDWACHRYSRIEETAGVKESLIHLLLLGEMGLPVLGTVFLEITSPVILMMVTAFLLHEITVYCDLRIANAEREVTPTEQMVHSVMEMMPLVGIWLVTLLREDEVRALLGTSARNPDFSLRLKEKPLPLFYRIALLSAIALLGGVPYLEELRRTARFALRNR